MRIIGTLVLGTLAGMPRRGQDVTNEAKLKLL